MPCWKPNRTGLLSGRCDMPSQQRLIHLKIGKLKNLSNVTIEFEEEKRLTAILGPNGFGKSTVLHVLAASFRPTKVTSGNTASVRGQDHRYIDFFPNTPHGIWSNTDLTVLHSYRADSAPEPSTQPLRIHKGIAQWRPFAKHRPERETYFIGVASATPAIEDNWPRSKLTYTTHDLTDAASMEIKQKAGHILQRDYTRYHLNALTTRRSLFGVEYQGVNYSSLSMGAGEQRLFEILRQVKAAGKYALILIDELDLLLHTDALHRLLAVLNDYANDKKLQIVFTTHRESVTNFDSFMAIRHLYRSPVAPYKTFCFNDTKPDAIYRLTGEIHRELSICCEDDIATAIIEKIAQEVGVGSHVGISKYGAARNCFTLAAALLLNQQQLDKALFVLDGDEYETEPKRLEQIKKALTGTEADTPARQQEAIGRIVQFCPQGLSCPEQSLYDMVVLRGQSDHHDDHDVVLAAAMFAAEEFPKVRFMKIMERLGGSRDRALVRIIDVAAKSEGWQEYTREVRAWLDEHRPNLVEAIHISDVA